MTKQTCCKESNMFQIWLLGVKKKLSVLKIHMNNSVIAL